MLFLRLYVHFIDRGCQCDYSKSSGHHSLEWWVLNAHALPPNKPASIHALASCCKISQGIFKMRFYIIQLYMRTMCADMNEWMVRRFWNWHVKDNKIYRLQGKEREYKKKKPYLMKSHTWWNEVLILLSYSLPQWFKYSLHRELKAQQISIKWTRTFST